MGVFLWVGKSGALECGDSSPRCWAQKRRFIAALFGPKAAIHRRVVWPKSGDESPRCLARKRRFIAALFGPKAAIHRRVVWPESGDESPHSKAPGKFFVWGCFVPRLAGGAPSFLGLLEQITYERRRFSSHLLDQAAHLVAPQTQFPGDVRLRHGQY